MRENLAYSTYFDILLKHALSDLSLGSVRSSGEIYIQALEKCAIEV
jgi:hypothetical protein